MRMEICNNKTNNAYFKNIQYTRHLGEDQHTMIAFFQPFE